MSSFKETAIDGIKRFSEVVTDCVFLMKVVKETDSYSFVYEYMNKQGMVLAQLTSRDIGRTIRQSNMSGQAQYIYI